MHVESVLPVRTMLPVKGFKDERRTACTEWLILPIFSYSVARAGVVCAFHVYSCVSLSLVAPVVFTHGEHIVSHLLLQYHRSRL